jgi:hypothetical protein
VPTTTGSRRLEEAGGEEPGRGPAGEGGPPAPPRPCSFCRRPAEPPAYRTIYVRDHRAPGGLRRDYLTFCSVRCADSYQMGCEG